MADTSKYTESDFITVESLGSEVRIEIITDVQPGKFGKLVLTFKSGKKLGLNKTRTKVMQQHYGMDDDDWLGKKIKLVAGKVPFGDDETDSVLIIPVSPSIPEAKPVKRKTKRPVAEEVDDGVPFEDTPPRLSA